MKKTIAVILIFLMFQSICSIHYADQLEKLTPDQIDSDNLVQVIQSSKTRIATKLERDYYSIKVMQKDKKDAYSRIRRVYQQVVKILIKSKLIPREDNLVKSKIKPQYLSRKRKWLFSTIFVIMGKPKQLQNTHQLLTKIGVQKLSTRPAINFLNEKIEVIQIFNSAKQKLAKKLQVLGDYEIHSVVQIQLKGKQVLNSDILEEQLQEQFNQSQEIIQEQDIAETQSVTAQGEIEMKILFKVGRKQEENSDDDEDYFGGEDQDEEQEDTDESQSQ